MRAISAPALIGAVTATACILLGATFWQALVVIVAVAVITTATRSPW